MAGLAIAGGVVALVGNLLAPRLNGDDAANYRTIAHSTRFSVAGFVLLAATLLVVAALVGIARSWRGTPHAELAYYGRLAVVVGGTIAFLQTGTELYGYKQQAKAFASLSDGNNNIVSAFYATNALDHLDAALFGVWTIVLLGIAPMLIGAVQWRARATTVWLGISAVAGGLVCAVVGVGLLIDSSPSDFDVPFLVGSLVVTLWVIATGALMWREPAPSEIDLTTPAEAKVPTSH